MRGTPVRKKNLRNAPTVTRICGRRKRKGVEMPKKGYRQSEETRKKMSESRKGKRLLIPRSEEWRRKQRESHLGLKRSQESRRKQSESNLGRISPMAGKHHSEETKRKMSESGKGRIVTDSTRKKIGNIRRGVKHTEESKRKMSEANIGRRPSEETRRKLSESHKGERCNFWKGGISFEPYCPDFNPSFKERVRKFFNRICVECGKTEIENGRRLDTHHVNSDKMTCCNTTKPLFVALCISCHSGVKKNPDYYEQHFTEIINEKYGGKCYLPKCVE